VLNVSSSRNDYRGIEWLFVSAPVERLLKKGFVTDYALERLRLRFSASWP
jgi:hypothetical protein